jgi:hypothetical protein
MISENFIWLALAITVIGNLFYVIDTLKGETQPNRISFFLWGATPLIAYFAQKTGGGGAQSAFTLVIGAMALLIFIASFIDKKAYWAITKFDIGCGILALIALVLLIATGNALLALWLSILGDFFASLPTVIKSFKFPESETVLAYATEIVSSLIILLTIQEWTFINYCFAIYVLLMNVMFTILLITPRKKLITK